MASMMRAALYFVQGNVSSTLHRCACACSSVAPCKLLGVSMPLLVFMLYAPNGAAH